MLETVLDDDFHHTRFNNLAKNVTDNRAFRREKSKQQREVNIDKEKRLIDMTLLTYAERIEHRTGCRFTQIC